MRRVATTFCVRLTPFSGTGDWGVMRLVSSIQLGEFAVLVSHSLANGLSTRCEVAMTFRVKYDDVGARTGKSVVGGEPVL